MFFQAVTLNKREDNLMFLPWSKDEQILANDGVQEHEEMHQQIHVKSWSLKPEYFLVFSQPEMIEKR